MKTIDRHYGMDWLRIGAFGLLILYHIGMYFVWWDWHVKAATPVSWTALPMLATNAWRIPLLFAVSGFASAAVLAKATSPGAFIASRSARLLIPLIFGIVVIVPVQPWIELTFKHGYAHGLWHFLTTDYFRLGALEGIVLPTWQHLWFVAYLWVYTMVTALLLIVLPATLRARIAGWADRALAGPGILTLPIAWLAAVTFVLFPGAEETHALIDDWAAHAVFLPIFLFGLMLARSTHAWSAIRRWWQAAALLAIAGYATVAGIELALPGEAKLGSEAATALFETARIVQGWCAIVALIGVADRFWNRDRPARAMLTEAVFPFYIIHQTIIVAAGWWLLPLALPNAAAFAILVAATVIGCWTFYRIGREVPGFRILIGLKGFRAGPGQAKFTRNNRFA